MAAAQKQNKSEEVQISLLPDQNGRAGAEIRMRVILIGILVFLIIATVASSLFLGFRAKKYRVETDNLAQSIGAMRAELKKEAQNADEVGNLGQRAFEAKSLLENHVASENALLFLEASTIPEITFKQLAFDSHGSLVVSGYGTQFSSLTRQLKSWNEHPRVKDATMSGISVAIDRIGNVEGVNFTSTITLHKEALRFVP